MGSIVENITKGGDITDVTAVNFKDIQDIFKMTEVTLTDDGGNPFGAYHVNEYILPKFGKTVAEAKEAFDNAPTVPVREDDCLLCTYPKTGTNWTFEILKMVLHSSAERLNINKMHTMIESTSFNQLNEQPSPRVLNTHFLPRHLPIGIKERKTKTVLCLRNPKDVAVSLYNHCRGSKAYGYSGKWENWLRPYLEGRWIYGKYSDYLNDWQELIEGGAEFPIHVMYYEDLKKNGRHELDRLVNFLALDLDDKLKADISEMCSFENMRKDISFAEFSWFLHDDFNFFRKGEVGDWKNWFTVAQNEMFDEMWKQNIRHDTVFNFKYC